ncbi:MAG: calcium-binding protein, partial [Cyanobacteria bacterium J06631_9]
LDGGAGNDTVDYRTSAAGYLQINLSGTTATSENGEVDTVLNIENVFGTQHSDDITGNGLSNTLKGNNGDDALYGEAGIDYLYGGNGNDSLYGGDDDDELYGHVGHDLLHGGNGNDTVTGGLGNDLLHGDDGNDILQGNRGNDTLLGGAGNDVLNGYGYNADRDQLTGGAGADTFVLGVDSNIFYLGSGFAKILDFNSSVDQLTFGSTSASAFTFSNIFSDGILEKTEVSYQNDLVAVLFESTVV